MAVQQVSVLQTIVTYCKRETCGDPIPSFGTVCYAKRQLVLARISFWGWTAVYRCPVCGDERTFRKLFWSSGYMEVLPPAPTPAAPPAP